MTTITIKINERSKYGKALLDFIKIGADDNKGVEIVKVPNAETIRAIENVKAGKGITRTSSHADLMRKLNA